MKRLACFALIVLFAAVFSLTVFAESSAEVLAINQDGTEKGGIVKLIHVNSSVIEMLGYDRSEPALYIKIHDDDGVYVYFGVTNSQYNALLKANSVGGYYNQYIKGAYDFLWIDLSGASHRGVLTPESVVYIDVRSGTQYHRTKDCNSLMGVLETKSVTKRDAEQNRYKPCGTCFELSDTGAVLVLEPAQVLDTNASAAEGITGYDFILRLASFSYLVRTPVTPPRRAFIQRDEEFDTDMYEFFVGKNLVRVAVDQSSQRLLFVALYLADDNILSLESLCIITALSLSWDELADMIHSKTSPESILTSMSDGFGVELVRLSHESMVVTEHLRLDLHDRSSNNYGIIMFAPI